MFCGGLCPPQKKGQYKWTSESTKIKSTLHLIIMTTKIVVIQWHLIYCGSLISVAPGYRITRNSEISCHARSQCSRPPLNSGDKLKYINRFFFPLPTTVMPLKQSTDLPTVWDTFAVVISIQLCATGCEVLHAKMSHII